MDYTRFVRAPVSERITESGAIRYAGVYDRAMVQAQTELIPVENITAPVLLISGEDDQAWSAAIMGEQVREAIEAANGTVTHLIYPDAGHIPALAYTPTA